MTYAGDRFHYFGLSAYAKDIVLRWLVAECADKVSFVKGDFPLFLALVTLCSVIDLKDFKDKGGLWR